MNKTSDPAVLTALRQATAPLHERLDRLVDLDRSTSDHQAYRRLLSAMLSGIAPVEASLRGFDWVGAGLDAEVATWRAPLLRRDLEVLGEAPIQAPPDAPSPAPYPSRSAAFGALYVIEGAALGGQVIFRQARERLGITAEQGGAFHAAHGRPPVGESWRRFRNALETHCLDTEAAVQAAVRTFLDLEARLAPLLSPMSAAERA
ncbi:biliverdin-producing heme oxygenase [Roseomonas elaeocarpi]|uniref:Biliverdin-producing heme oxygenase n=1 Tax=Roseomonas elaeocarpi TaxID=907779 RepID=A0ABV6JV48_9PROT